MSEKIKNNLGITLKSIILGLGLYFFGRIIRSNIYFPLFTAIEESNPVIYEIIRYFGHICFLIILITYFKLVKEERHHLKKFKFSSKRKDFIWIALGLAIGFIMNGLCILAAYLHGDIDMVHASFNPGLLMLLFIAIAFQSSVEEFESRLWTFSRINETAGLTYGIIGSSLTFALCHMLNPGISIIALTNIFLVGVLYAVAYHYTKSIWFTCAMHTAWNFTQNSIFGLPNSGNAAVLTIMNPTYTNKSIFYDPEFGVEGTIVTTAVTALAIILTIVIGKKAVLTGIKQQANNIK